MTNQQLITMLLDFPMEMEIGIGVQRDDEPVIVLFHEESIDINHTLN